MKYIVLISILLFSACSYQGCPCNSAAAKHNRAELAKHSNYN